MCMRVIGLNSIDNCLEKNVFTRCPAHTSDPVTFNVWYTICWQLWTLQT